MRIGIDFDNTIVSYGTLFFDVASSLGLVSVSAPLTKDEVRSFLRQSGKEDEWTRVQGIVYGKEMHRAKLFPGVREFLDEAAGQGHECFIVSHKTRHPVIGEDIDLHEVARLWLKDNSVKLPAYFELSQPEKAARIRELRCEFFIDDLPEFLFAEVFPKDVRKIFFDPEGNWKSAVDAAIVRTWAEISGILLKD